MRFTRRQALAAFTGVAAGQTLESPALLQQEPRRYLQPGAVLRLPPGRFGPLALEGRGEPSRPIRIEALDPNDPPVFHGLLYLSRCAWLTFDGLVFEDADVHSINADDGGEPGSAAGLVFRNLTFRRCGADPLKIAGINDFTIEACRFEQWAGAGIAMVGCHRGQVSGCSFHHDSDVPAGHGVQLKGGSKSIEITRCFFTGSAHRWVNIGGTSLRSVFRPPDAHYEAEDVTIEGNRFVGGNAAVVWSAARGGVVRGNTIYQPREWICRIMQEGPDGIDPCRDGVFERNLVVYDGRALRELIQKRRGADWSSFAFRENAWFDVAGERYPRYRPWAHWLTPSFEDLPAEETGGVYGVDPELIDAGGPTMRVGNSSLTKHFPSGRIGA